MSVRGLDRDPPRGRIASTLVELVGSRGYDATSVEMVCERALVRHSDFERCFADKEDCFLSVYDEIASEFCRRVQTAQGVPGSWHDRIWAAGWAAMRYLAEESVRARFFIAEVNGAGSRARERRDRILQGLADLVDTGRQELDEPGSISRCSAEFVAGEIYSTVLAKVQGGCIERGEDFLPELVYMAVMPYLGSRAAEDELLVQALR